MTILPRNAIDENSSGEIILDSYILFIVGAMGVPIYIFSLYDTLALHINSAFGWKMLLYYAVGILIFVGLYISTTVIKINKIYIVKKHLFGFFGFSTYKIICIREFKIKCDSTGRATLLRITFEDGRQLEFAYFQRNFSKALSYIISVVPDLEISSK